MSAALQCCVGKNGLESVTGLVLMGSAGVRRLVASEQEIPYSCGDMMDVVTAVGGGEDLADELTLRDICPLPMGQGGAVNVAVETAQEVLLLARDSLERDCVEAAETKEPLKGLCGLRPVQAVMASARSNFTTRVETALEAGAEADALASLAVELKAERIALVEDLQSAEDHRRKQALKALEGVMQEQEDIVKELAASSAQGFDSAVSRWKNEMRLVFDAETKCFKCLCQDVCFTVGFEYAPAVFPHPTAAFAAGFAKAFDPLSAGDPKVLLLTGCERNIASSLVCGACAVFGGVPVVLHGSSLTSRESYWARISAAVVGNGSALPILVIEDAGLADVAALHSAFEASKESRFAICLGSGPGRAVQEASISRPMVCVDVAVQTH